jgi:hypothetical protein
VRRARSNSERTPAFYWCFRNHDTDEITIAQAPNLVLWIVIVAGILWVSPSSGKAGVVLMGAFNGGPMVWAVDEMLVA